MKKVNGKTVKQGVAEAGGDKLSINRDKIRADEVKFKNQYKKFLESQGIEATNELLDEGWQQKLASLGAATAIGAAALGGAGQVQAAPSQIDSKATMQTQQIGVKQAEIQKRASEFSKINKGFANEYQGLQQKMLAAKDKLPKASDIKTPRDMRQYELEKSGIESSYHLDLQSLLKKYNAMNENKLDEKLNKSMSAGEVISDFVHSDDPKFKGKSKKERTKMALGAYYGMHPEKSKKDAKESMDPQMESWNRELNALLNEGLTVTTSTGQPGGSDSVSISATDEDAKLLMRMVQDAGLMRGQSQAMSMPASDHSHDTVEPVSHDEVMGTLEPVGDEGEGDLSFIKRMLGARADHSGSTSGDYEQEDGHGVCGECGHEECQCDHDQVDEEQVDEKRQRNFNPHDELSGRGRISPFNKTAAGRKAEFDRGTEELKDKIKFTRDQGGVAGPKGHLPEGEVDEELHGRQTELDKDDDGDIDEKDLAMLRAGKDKKVDEEALDQPATMEGKGEHCDECGAMMEEGHECKEEAMEGLNEWANSRGGSSRDEAFMADMAFMNKVISGGLNNMKQDQTVLPSARVKTGAEVKNPETSIAELLRKLSNIN